MGSAHETPELLFGGATLGLENSEFTTAEGVAALLTRLRDHHVVHLDTAARYPPTKPGQSETLLGAAGAGAAGFTIDTKLAFDQTATGGDVTPAAARASIRASLARLGVKQVRTLYLHRPDMMTPLAVQVAALAALRAEGVFERLGLSNFSATQVRDFVQACDAHGGPAIRPQVLQGDFNLIERDMERTLLPTLREFGMKFVAYRSLAAGFMTGSFQQGGQGREGTRFSAAHPLGKHMQSVYDTPRHHKAWRMLTAVLEPHGIAPPEAGLRWIVFHSVLGKGDGVILGASKTAQIEQNLAAVEKGPLPSEVVEVLNSIWDEINKDDSASE